MAGVGNSENGRDCVLQWVSLLPAQTVLGGSGTGTREVRDWGKSQILHLMMDLSAVGGASSAAGGLQDSSSRVSAPGKSPDWMEILSVWDR